MELHHRLEGPEDAPVLVLSNSLGTDMRMWDELLPALACRFRVLRYDQRGHGRSPAPPGPYTVAELGRDVLDLLDRLGLERVSWCGVSLGGMTGAWLAIEAPERLDRLALCCTSAHLPPAEMWTDRAATVRAQGVAAVADAQLERWFTPAARPEVLERSRRTLLAVPAEGYAGCCEAIAAHDLRDRLAAIRTPTLVLSTAEDPATPPEHGRALAAGIGGARFRLLERGRHLVAVEDPDAVAREVLGHLATSQTV